MGNRYVLCPGPGHSRRDRSLKVKFKSDGTFTVTSFAGDNWQACKDFIRDRLGIPNDWRREPVNDDAPVVELREREDDEPARIRTALQRWGTRCPAHRDASRNLFSPAAASLIKVTRSASGK